MSKKFTGGSDLYKYECMMQEVPFGNVSSKEEKKEKGRYLSILRQFMSDKYPVLYGYTEDNERTELHGINEVAEYICRKGLYSDLKIVTELDQLLVNTMNP